MVSGKPQGLNGKSLTFLLLCWNHARYLDQCIDALAAQTSRDFDVVFLDNASGDGSAELAERLLGKSGIPHRIIRNSEPKGIAANLNALLAAATGELVAPLSTDDWYAPTYVEQVIAAARREPEAAMIAVNGWSEYETDGTTVPSDIAPYRAQAIGNRFLEDRDAFFWVGLCYRRAVLDTLGGWDPGQSIEDIDLIFRLTRGHRVTQLPDRLVHYRRTSQSVSLDPLFMTHGRVAFFRRHRAHFAAGYRHRMAELYRSGAAVCLDQGRTGDAAGLLVRGVVRRPLDPAMWRTAAYWLRRALRAR